MADSQPYRTAFLLWWIKNRGNHRMPTRATVDLFLTKNPKYKTYRDLYENMTEVWKAEFDFQIQHGVERRSAAPPPAR